MIRLKLLRCTMKSVFMRQPSKKEVIMIQRTFSTLSRITGAAAIIAGGAFAEPARAEGPLSNYGPVVRANRSSSTLGVSASSLFMCLSAARAR
jgi:hypothetical protein